MRILLPADLVDILTMREAIDVVGSAFEDFGRNPSLNTPRRRVHTPAGVRVSVHQGAPISQGATGLMTHCELVQADGKEQIYRIKHPPVQVIFDANDGSPLGVVIGDPGSPNAPPHALSGLRTAATSAIGTTKLAASTKNVSLGIFGSGEQARYHLLALAELMDLSAARVYSRTRGNCELYVKEMSRLLPSLRLEIASSPDDLVDKADVILCCTNASVPVFDGSRLRPGQHVTSIVGSNVGLMTGGFVPKKRREVDDATIIRADRIVVNSIEQLEIDQQADVYEHAVKGVISWDKVFDLGQVMADVVPGRESADQITLFKNNGGQGIADVAIGAAVLRKAQERNLGTVVDVDSVESRSNLGG